MRTFEQDLRELNISAEQFDSIIAEIYDMTNEEMTEAAKRIREGTETSPAWERAFERVLSIRYTERQEAYDIYYGKEAVPEKMPEGKKLIVDGTVWGKVSSYYQNNEHTAWIFNLETDQSKSNGQEVILSFDRIQRFTNDADWNLCIDMVPQKSAAEVSPNMSRIAAIAESGVSEVPSGTFKFGQLETLKRESQILGVDKYLNFNKRDCDIAVEKGFLEKFNKSVEETAERQQSRKVQEKRIEGPKL